MSLKDWISTLAYLFWMPILVLTILGMYVTLFIE